MNGLKMNKNQKTDYFNITLEKYRGEIKTLTSMKEYLWTRVWDLHQQIKWLKVDLNKEKLCELLDCMERLIEWEERDGRTSPLHKRVSKLIKDTKNERQTDKFERSNEEGKDGLREFISNYKL